MPILDHGKRIVAVLLPDREDFQLAIVKSVSAKRRK